MYGYGDFDGPVFRASAGEFGRYGGRASLRSVEHCGWQGGGSAPLRPPGFSRRSRSNGRAREAAPRTPLPVRPCLSAAP